MITCRKRESGSLEYCSGGEEHWLRRAPPKKKTPTASTGESLNKAGLILDGTETLYLSCGTRGVKLRRDYEWLGGLAEPFPNGGLDALKFCLDIHE